MLTLRPRFTSWLIATAGWGLILFVATDQPSCCDAIAYWNLSTELDSPFSILDHSDSLRGWGYPWLLRLGAWFASPVSTDPAAVGRLLSLIAVPVLLCAVAPAIAEQVSPRTRVTVGRILILNLLFALFWRLELVHTLSDVPALTLAAAGTAMLLHAVRLPLALAAGMAFGLAVNMRPSYGLAVGVAILGLFMLDQPIRRTAVRAAAVVIGVGLLTLPQIVINLEHHDRASPMPVESSGLTELQVTEGLRLGRYETFVGEDVSGLSTPGMRFQNRALSAEVPDDLGLSEVPAFVLDHPVDVSAAYVRHLVSGLDVGFGTSYIVDPARRGIVLPILNYTLIAATLLVLARRWLGRRETAWRSPTTWFVLVLVAASTPSVIGATEARFVLPLHVSLLAVAALTIGRADIPGTPRQRAGAALVVIGLVAASLTISADTLASLEERPLLVDGTPAGDGNAAD